jgi:hypothetical protein
MKTLIGMLLVSLAIAGTAFAGATAPEIDGGSAPSAVALIGGASLLIWSRCRRK